MKLIKYLFVVLSLFLFSCAGDDDAQREMIVADVDLTDFHMYIGSVDGAIEYKYGDEVPEDKVDSLRSAIISRRLTSYKKDLYSNSIVEFNGSKISYVYRDTTLNSVRKIIADYRFENDSLFALKSDASELFIAQGAQLNALYRMVGIARYRSGAQYVQKTGDEIYDLESVLELYGSALTNPNDTLIWLNAKYLFK